MCLLFCCTWLWNACLFHAQYKYAFILAWFQNISTRRWQTAKKGLRVKNRADQLSKTGAEQWGGSVCCCTAHSSPGWESLVSQAWVCVCVCVCLCVSMCVCDTLNSGVCTYRQEQTRHTPLHSWGIFLHWRKTKASSSRTVYRQSLCELRKGSILVKGERRNSCCILQMSGSSFNIYLQFWTADLCRLPSLSQIPSAAFSHLGVIHHPGLGRRKWSVCRHSGGVGDSEIPEYCQ